jgi:hypothetical protein
MECFPELGIDSARFLWAQCTLLFFFFVIIIIFCLFVVFVFCFCFFLFFVFPHSLRKAQWMDAANRRKFFENYAKEQRFDPLISENWYSQRKENIMARKVFKHNKIKKAKITVIYLQGAFSVVSYYKCSLSNAIMSLFPEVRFVKAKFTL